MSRELMSKEYLNPGRKYPSVWAAFKIDETKLKTFESDCVVTVQEKKMAKKSDQRLIKII